MFQKQVVSFKYSSPSSSLNMDVYLIQATMKALCKQKEIKSFEYRPLASLLIGFLSDVLVTEQRSVIFSHFTFLIVSCHVSFNCGFLHTLLSICKLVVNIGITYLSYLYAMASSEKRFTRYAKHMETLFKATKFERIVQNVRNGYGILNNQTINFCNEQFCQALGTKTKAQAIHNLKSILRKPRPHHQNGTMQSKIDPNARVSKQFSEKGVTFQRTVSVMEDILNFLKNRPSVDLDEDIEYFLERTDVKTNQKFYRFF